MNNKYELEELKLAYDQLRAKESLPLAFFSATIVSKAQLSPLQRSALNYAELGKFD